MILPKSLEHIRKWTDRHKIHYSIESSVIGDPVEYTMTFRKRGAYIVKISGSELDHTVDFNNTMAKEYLHEWMCPRKAIMELKKAMRRGT
ncbi:MAG: hypothetical protein Q4B26_05505 [Eubacteriales bacterium]|nr:hypothetical protein [Eubacteriales bacterium]